jgi:uncharacterized membrane protein
VTDSVRESIVVDAPADAVMAVIGDFPAYPQWQAEVCSAEVLEADQAGRGTIVRFVLDALGLRTTLVLAYRYLDREASQGMRWTLVESDNVRRDDGAYTLEQLADGRTRMDYELSVEPAVPLPGFVRRAAAKRIVDAALRSMKRQVERGPGR